MLSVIRQLTDRKALHLAELLQLALREGEPSRSSGTLRRFLKAVEPKLESEKEIDMNRQPSRWSSRNRHRILDAGMIRRQA